MNLAHWIERAGRSDPDRSAVALGSHSVLTYGLLADRVARLAGALRNSLGLARGDRVAIAMKNVPQYPEVMFAAFHAGLAAVPINAKLHAQEFRYVLDNCRAKICFVTPDTAGPIEDARGEHLQEVFEAGSAEYEALLQADPIDIAYVAPSDLAWLFYTSGTTGQPKGAMLTHRNLTAAALNYFADFDRVRPGDSILHSAPMSHGSGLWMFPHIAARACNVIPESGGFDPAEIFRLIETWPGLSMFAAPTMVRRLTVHPGDADTGNLKLLSFGGAPMYVEDCIAALDRFGPKLAQLYGQGESPMTITHLSREDIADRNHPKWLHRLSTAGIPDSCLHVRVVDESGVPVATGEKGEIVCRGDSVMPGYWEDPQATAKALKDGWLWTGDVGQFDEDGYLSLTDRSKDMIISGGSNIYPREIEEVLLRADGVSEVSVIGRPDPDWGEIVVAYVVGTTGYNVSQEALNTHCLDHIARFKRPKLYRFVEALPKNNYGKVLKTELRRREEAFKR